MRILLLCAADLNGCINLNTLLSALAPRHTVSVLLSSLDLPTERGHFFADMKVWYEKDFPLRVLFPRLDASGDNAAEWLTFAGLARRWQVPVIGIDQKQPMECILQNVEAFRPELLFCCRFDYILRKEVLHYPGLQAAFNLHSGLLPQCAGPDATFWAMHKGWKVSGSTLHLITEEIDGGDIVETTLFELDYGHSLLWNRMRAYVGGIRAFQRLLGTLEQGGTPAAHPQARERRRYYPFPSFRDFASFHEAGRCLVDESGYADLMRRFVPSGMDLPAYRFCPQGEAPRR